ncbi:unnamed protein product [Blepharisma stoltei]|uniref:General transcription factor TFIIB n=1 Tax=Blepharisma stoltei TaxID=1481888 RepID=A0AAU9IYX6_9CILI|nr:unnamed protein product [Blepharisma stoltei]
MSIFQCIECKALHSLVVDEREGTVVCKKCGRIQIDKLIDDGPEWRNLTEEDGSRDQDPCRIGAPNNELLSDKGLCTVISKHETHYGLARWAQRSMSSSQDKTLSMTFSEIDDFCHILCLSDSISEEAKKIFRVLFLKKVTKGKSHIGILSAIIYCLCRKYGNKIPLKEILNINKITKNEIVRCYNTVKIHAPEAAINREDFSLFAKLAINFDFSNEMVTKCAQAMKKIKDCNLMVNEEEMALACAISLMVSWMSGKENLYPEDLRKTSGISEDDIRKCYRKLFLKRFFIFNGLGDKWSIATVANF